MPRLQIMSSKNLFMAFKNQEMKNFNPVLFILFFFSTSLLVNGQKSEWRIPLKVGAQFAVIDENEKEIFPAEYDDIRVYNDQKILLLSKNGLWGVYSFSGQKLLDHVMAKVGSGYGQAIVEQVKIANSGLSSKSNSGLTAINDFHANVKYYVNPNKLLPSYKPYSNQLYRGSENVYTIPESINNAFYVLNRDRTVNVIDSTGKEILPYAKKDIQIINNQVFAAKENENFALFQRDKQVSPYAYSSVVKTYNNGNFIVTKNVKTPNIIKKFYYFFNKECMVIDSSEHYPDSYEEKYIIMNHEKGFVLYTSDGKKIFNNQEYKGSLFNLGSQIYITTSQNYKKGIMTLSGEEIIKPRCEITNHYGAKMISVWCDEKVIIRDSLMNEIFTIENAEDCTPIVSKQLYIIGYKDQWRRKYGVVDENKNVIIELKWTSITWANCNDLLYMENDSIRAIGSLGKRNLVVSLPKEWRLTIYPNCTYITANHNEGLFKTYDMQGKELMSGNQKESIENQKYGPHKYKIVGESKSYVLEDKNKVRVLNETFQEILAIKDGNNESIYICQFSQKNHPTTKTLNNNLKVITPPGYSVPASWQHYNKNNPGTLIVVNDADGTAKSYTPRIGICDFKGQWLVKPFKGAVKHVENGVFVLTDYDQRKLRIVDPSGNRTSNEDFDDVEMGGGSDFFQNRMLVGKMLDSDYSKKLKALNLDNIDPKTLTEEQTDVLMEKIKALGMPKMIYGYLNSKGKEVLPLQYVAAQPFPMQGIKTQVAIERKGKTYSQIIDTSGRVFLELELDELESFDQKDTTMYKGNKDGLWGIVTPKGASLTPFQFDEIYRLGGDSFYASQGESRYLINSEFKVLDLGKWYNVRHSYTNGFFNVKFINKDLKSPYTFTFYSDDLNTLGSVVGVDISDSFNGSKLPKGYVMVKTDFQNKSDYIYDIVRQKKVQR